MKPIPTEYSGIQFRSRLEARYAMFFDSLGMGWAYEVEGVEIGNGSRYLPDFWLPDSRVYFEVKGPLRDRIELVNTAQRYVDEQSGGHLEIDYPLFVIGDECGNLRAGNGGSEIWLAHCVNCRCWYALTWEMGWACRACGHHDGDGTYDETISRIALPQMQWRPAGRT